MNRFHIVLHEPQIPPNTGSIARTCAAAGAKLHLIGPMGFSIDDRQVKRAGLDYWPYVEKRAYDCWESFLKACPEEGITHIHAFSSKVQASYTRATFVPGQALLFGREDGGLPRTLPFGAVINQWWTVPIDRNYVRSLNLSVCVGVVLFEALRQAAEMRMQLRSPSALGTIDS